MKLLKNITRIFLFYVDMIAHKKCQESNFGRIPSKTIQPRFEYQVGHSNRYTTLNSDRNWILYCTWFSRSVLSEKNLTESIFVMFWFECWSCNSNLKWILILDFTDEFEILNTDSKLKFAYSRRGSAKSWFLTFRASNHVKIKISCQIWNLLSLTFAPNFRHQPNYIQQVNLNLIFLF